jgi:hypothetical protein
MSDFIMKELDKLRQENLELRSLILHQGASRAISTGVPQSPLNQTTVDTPVNGNQKINPQLYPQLLSEVSPEAQKR